MYSVMQSDGNSFYGIVVMDSIIMAYRDEYSILEQIHEKQIFLDLYYEDLKFTKVIEENAYLKKNNTLQQGTLIELGFTIDMKNQNHHNKKPNIFAFHIFCLKCCPIP